MWTFKVKLTEEDVKLQELIKSFRHYNKKILDNGK